MKQKFHTRQTQKLCAFLTIFALTFFWQSCKKQVIPLPQDPNVENTIDNPKHIRATYLSNPLPGNNPANFSANSSANLTLNGAMGPHLGGMIKAQVYSQSGNQFVIKIYKQAGGNFPAGTVGRLRMGSVSYTSLASTTLASSSNVISITIYMGFNQGWLNLMPIAEFGGSKYYAEPISIYTNPAYNTNNISIPNALLGTVNGVDIKCPGPNNNNPGNSQWWCTEFCARYYTQVYGHPVNSYGPAKTWRTTPPNGLLGYAPGTIAPRVGDILVFTNAGAAAQSGAGHVMIIIEVATSYIKVAHQNGGFYPNGSPPNVPIATVLQRSGNTITPLNNYVFNGLVRKP